MEQQAARTLLLFDLMNPKNTQLSRFSLLNGPRLEIVTHRPHIKGATLHLSTLLLLSAQSFDVIMT